MSKPNNRDRRWYQYRIIQLEEDNQRLRGLLRLFYKNGIHDLEDKRFYTDVGLEEVAAVEKELSDG